MTILQAKSCRFWSKMDIFDEKCKKNVYFLCFKCHEATNQGKIDPQDIKSSFSETFGSRSQGSENRLFWVIFAHLFELLLQLCMDLAIIAQECAEGSYKKT